MRVILSQSTWVAPLTAILLVGLTPFAAAAHERREVSNYQLVVGFNTEPALQAEPNAAQVTVTVPSESNRPVEGLADSLRVSIAYGGGAAKEFKLRSAFSTPGRYVADFIPTRAGSYLFAFTGTIEGTPVNERFESGPGRFSDVDPVETIQFPEQIPPANEAARMARIASEDAAEAQSMVAQARTTAMAGIGVGGLGLLIALVALTMAAQRR